MKPAILTHRLGCRNIRRAASCLVRAFWLQCFLWLALITRVEGGSAEGEAALLTPATSPSRTVLAQISTRAYVGGGNGAIIAGYMLDGNQSKRLLVRGLGPSLNLPGTMLDPYLALYQQDGPAGYNDDWGDSQGQEIIDSGIAPGDHAESAVLQSFSTGPYTAVLYGHGPDVGIAIAEVYDLDLSTDSRLVNISTRALVKPGDDLMIAGFIALGQEPLRVILRAIGPTLPVFGNLDDPILELRNANADLLGLNDNWRSDQEAEIIATTIPPTDERESALVRTLVPGAYTALVRGVNNASGLALVEVYALN